MMRLPIYHVDAFADAVFHGNPAAVCPLQEWLPDAVLQSIACENNLSETAFFLTGRDPAPLRWFTPAEEVRLCGHATLAAAFVILSAPGSDRENVAFQTKSGLLHVTLVPEGYSLRLPRISLRRCSPPAALVHGLGVVPLEVWATRDDPNYIAIMATADDVASLKPALHFLEKLHPHGVAVSAAGRSVDYVTRYFAPGYGIAEDPVTGSIHCALGPYWADRLGRPVLSTLQLSRRGGAVGVRMADDGVHLTGSAVRYLMGEIEIPSSIGARVSTP